MAIVSIPNFEKGWTGKPPGSDIPNSWVNRSGSAYFRGDVRIDGVVTASGIYPPTDATNYPGNNMGEKIAAAIASLPTTVNGGTVDARGFYGDQDWTSPVPIRGDVMLLLGVVDCSLTSLAFTFYAGNLFVEGQAIDITWLTLSGSGQWNINPAYASQDIGFSNLTVYSTSASVNAVLIGHATSTYADMARYVTIFNVAIFGPGINAAGSAKGVNVVGMDQSRWTNVTIQSFPGVGLYMDGDYGAENHFTNVNVDSSGSWSIHIKRLAQTAVGGWTFNDCSMSNRSYAAYPLSKGLYFDMPGPTQENTSNLFWIGGSVDQIHTGSAFYIKNCQHVVISNPQVHSFSTDADDAAFRFDNVNHVSVSGVSANAYTKVFSFESVCIGYNLVGNTLFSSAGNNTTTYGYWFDSATGKGDFDVINTNEVSGVTTSLLALTNNYSWMQAARTSIIRIPNAVGWSVRGDLTLYNISNDNGTSTKTLSVDDGDFRLKGSGGTQILEVTDAGAMTVTSTVTAPAYVVGAQAGASGTFANVTVVNGIVVSGT